MGVPVPDTGEVTEDEDSGGFLVTSGDVDYWIGNDTGAWTAQTIAGAYGSQLVIDEDGNWTYTADNDHPAIQALGEGETLTEVFTVVSAQGTTTITITIRGRDEPPCFVAGTLIDTPRGPRPIESLRAGDEVITRDNGVQRIRWAGMREISLLGGGAEAEQFQPIRIRRNALGPGVPDRDLLLSPMHRVLIRDPLVGLLTGQDEVLCPVQRLVNGRSVIREARSSVSYHHLLFDDHQVLTSSGCDSESFYPGAIGLEGFAEQTREEVLGLFPELRSLPESYGPTARQVVKRHEALLLAERLTPGERLLESLKARAA
ncbi:MAG: Hint domain-containing protein [Roseovarius sp.]